MIKNTLIVLFAIATLACSHPKETKNSTRKTETKEPTALSKADSILAKSVKAHGGDLYNSAHYKFTFRDGIYSFKNNGNNYRYTKQEVKDGNNITDTLSNAGFVRYINNEKQTLSEKYADAYSNSLNSVIYFATLPHKLQDPAVSLYYQGDVKIKNKNYHAIEVKFAQEGGGKDFDDEYYYWVNTETNRIDYLAYNYTVNEGGVRFRSAFNPRVVDGILFQDYINYKAELGTDLDKLPALYENNELKELSKILTEKVVEIN